jgi:chemotaxis protein methyltransferase CheR
MSSAGAEIAISDEEFFKFREFFYRWTGIHFTDTKRYFVDKRILERIRQTKSESFGDYFRKMRLESSGEEVQRLVNCLTVNETYFYRESYQFECLANSVLREVTERLPRGSRVRIWSMPCSTGEEPYSIALWLLEKWPKVDDYAIEIIASDIDTQVLSEAREGIYGARSLQNVEPATVRKYFNRLDAERYQIVPELRESIEFSLANISDPAQMRRYRDVDVIFCRNLLIYFDDISRRKAAEQMWDCLKPGGFVCLGHSESMSRISSLFEVRKFPEAIVYQKQTERTPS